MGDPQLTLEVLATKFRRFNLDEKQINHTLFAGLFGLAFSSEHLTDDQNFCPWLATALADLEPKIDPAWKKSEDEKLCVKRNAAIDAKVAAAHPDDLAKFARLAAVGLPLRNHLAPLFDPGLLTLSKEQSSTLGKLTDKLALTDARRMVATWPSRTERAVGYSHIACVMAQVGEVRAAAILTGHPDLADLSTLDDASLAKLAETYARLGQPDMVRSVFAQMDRDSFKRILPHLLVMAATVARDFSEARDLMLAIKDPKAASSTVMYAVDAYLT